MRIKIDKELKISLLEAMQRGYFTHTDLDVMNAKLNTEIRAPRVLTKQEQAELWKELEKTY